MGIGLSVVGIFTIDYFYPNSFENVPYVNTFVDYGHYYYNRVYYYFYPGIVNLDDIDAATNGTIFSDEDTDNDIPLTEIGTHPTNT